MPKTLTWPDDYQRVDEAFRRGYLKVIVGDVVDINPAALSSGLEEVVKCLKERREIPPRTSPVPRRRRM